MGKIIAVVNQKGGVGKTTSAVNLTAALHDLGLKVLLCDFDPQANATSGMGVDKRKIKYSIYDVTINEGICYVVFPEDVHMPGRHLDVPNDFVKVVVKLAV